MKTADLFVDTHFVNGNKMCVITSNHDDTKSNPIVIRNATDTFGYLLDKCITYAIYLISKKGYCKVIIDTVDYKTIITITNIHGPKFGAYTSHNNINFEQADFEAKMAHVSIDIELDGRYNFNTLRGKIRKLIYKL